VKIPTTATKKERPGKHALLDALVNTCPEVPFDWAVEWKETNASQDAILEMESRLVRGRVKFFFFPPQFWKSFSLYTTSLTIFIRK